MKFDRIALGPVRAAARSGRGMLADEAERAVDAIFGGPMPEAIGRSLAENRVLERIVAEYVETAAPGGLNGRPAEELLERIRANPTLAQLVPEGDPSQVLETVAARITASPAFKQALKETLSSPEIRAALAEQSVGAAAGLAEAARDRARTLDDVVGRRNRSVYGGFGTRGVALVIDAALAQLAFVVAVGSISLVAGLAGAHAGALAGSLAGVGWLLVVALYFAGFWSATASTPGMRVMHLRVLTSSGTAPSVGRSILRFAGLILAIIPLFAGFLPVFFDHRRRALQDYLAGTVVVYQPDA